MHSFHTNSANFHFNGDFCGDIIINDKSGNEVTINSEDLLKFIAFNYIQTKLVDQIEQMDYKQLIDLSLKIK